MPVVIAVFMATFLCQLFIPWDKWPLWLFATAFLLNIVLIIVIVATLQINYGLPVIILG